MSREIKFRGRTVSGEWVHGLLARKGSQYYISNNAGAPFAYEVFLGTVGQYTGLKDKNGVEIYEGDIVKWGDKKAEIQWYKNGYIFADEVLPDYSTVLNPYSNFNYEVVGNRYENPELLS